MSGRLISVEEFFLGRIHEVAFSGEFDQAVSEMELPFSNSLFVYRETYDALEDTYLKRALGAHMFVPLLRSLSIAKDKLDHKDAERLVMKLAGLRGPLSERDGEAPHPPGYRELHGLPIVDIDQQKE